jgi:hypothetical protein
MRKQQPQHTGGLQPAVGSAILRSLKLVEKYWSRLDYGLKPCELFRVSMVWGVGLKPLIEREKAETHPIRAAANA